MKHLSSVRATLCGIAALTCGPAEAMMPPSTYDDALAAADTHLQLAVASRELVPVTERHGLCVVTGSVLLVFRGPVQVGDEVSVGVPCRHEEAEVPLGGTIFTPVGDLQGAVFLELLLQHDADGLYRIAADGKGLAIIEGPSPQPMIELPE